MKATWNRNDIVAAWLRLESDYNVGGCLRERASNARRLESCDSQVARMFNKRRCQIGLPYAPWTWRRPADRMTRNAWQIYRNAEARLGLARDEWRIELTDTFGGEPNFGWIKRATFTTRAGASQRAIVREAKRALDLCGRWNTESYGDTYTMRASGACLVAFINPVHP